MARITKKDLQRTVDSLNERLSISEKKMSENWALYIFLKDTISEAIFDDRHSHTTEEIMVKIGNLQGRVWSEGALLPGIDHSLKDQNVKLYYLLRLALDDKNLEEPVDPENGQSKFFKPNFNR